MCVNSAFIEKVSCPYISQPTSPFSFRAPINCMSVQANEFKRHQLIWSLEPTYLTQDALEKKSVNLYFSVGPRYNSLF
jgi:hypothetical protein